MYVQKGQVTLPEEYYLKQLSVILNVHPNFPSPPKPYKVTDYLLFGSRKDAENWKFLKENGVTHVLNMVDLKRCAENPYPKESCIIGFKAFDAVDREGYDIMQHFPSVKTFIDQVRSSDGNDGKVFVHCEMGVNRSAAICCAYLMTEHRINLFDAVKKMKAIRGVVLTNRGFQRQLIKLARQNNLLYS